MERSGSVVIAWEADGYAVLEVRAPRRSAEELRAFAGSVADAALVNRSVAALRTALREGLPPDPAFELRPGPRQQRPAEARLVVTLRPPHAEPHPEPDEPPPLRRRPGSGANRGAARPTRLR